MDKHTPSVEVTNLAAPVTPWSDEDVLMGILGFIKRRGFKLVKGRNIGIYWDIWMMDRQIDVGSS